MSSYALIVENIGKAYTAYSSEVVRFARWFGWPVRPMSEHWVLRNVSFRIAMGESVGIIGQNGAGKSTLLKMITGTTLPTEGGVAMNGRVAALLELGLGFNPELTGRENAIHACGLMGLSHQHVQEVLPQIEAFAEVGEYFDEPIRTYSSGMQMRVAFSVATAVRPDVLIVDEALAVGDAYFIHKCFQRIREFQESGTTLLLVSHDPTAIQTLCNRAVLLDGGRMILDGPPNEVFDYYNALIAEKENAGVRTERSADGLLATESGSGEATLDNVCLLNDKGEPVEYVEVGSDVVLSVTARIHGEVPRLVFGYMIRDRLGQPVFGTNTHHTEQAVEGLHAGDVVEFKARFKCNLGAGTFSVSLALSSTETHLVKNYQWRDLALVFTVANVGKSPFVGLAWIPPEISAMTKRPLVE